jgi:hypothetical protein
MNLQSTKANDIAFQIARWGILGFMGIAVLLLLASWLRPEKDQLAERYHVAPENVFIEPKPHGCDFDDAPLGNKHCHFERQESTVKSNSGEITAVYVTWHKAND